MDGEACVICGGVICNPETAADRLQRLYSETLDRVEAARGAPLTDWQRTILRYLIEGAEDG